VRRGYRLGELFGIEIRADLSLLVLAVLLTWSLYLDLALRFPGTSRGTLLVAAVGTGVAFMASVLVHELSHSLVAVRRGLEVRRIRLFMFGGMSEIASEAKQPRDELAISLAGPVASLGLGVLFLLAAWLMPGRAELVERLALVLGLANVAIAVFNLLPGFPLDGGRVVRALVWRAGGDRRRATRSAATTGRVLGWVMVAAGVVVWVWLRDLWAVWLAVVGWFLLQAASVARRRQELLDRIVGMTVADVMRPVTMTVAGDDQVADVLALHGWGERLRTMPVVVDGRVGGVLGTREVGQVAAPQRAETPAKVAMTPIGPDDVFEAGLPFEDALTRQPGAAGVMVVVDGDRVVGLVAAEEMAAALGDSTPRG
jgi:Zn-dependent protease